jgi:7-carboxy-7-deazaguanine synthase
MKTLKSKLPVVEKFYSIQGEGEKMGYPSIFIRLGGCNLTCEGFGCQLESPKTGEIIIGCDSIRAVSAHFKDTWTMYEDWKSLVEDVNRLVMDNYQKPIIIITGGEPMLHRNNSVLIDTIEYYISRDYGVWFETNGTI